MTDDELIRVLKDQELKLEELIQNLLTAPRIDRYALIYHFDQLRMLCRELRRGWEKEAADTSE